MGAAVTSVRPGHARACLLSCVHGMRTARIMHMRTHTQEFPGLSKDFTLIVSNVSSGANWLSTALTGSTPDGLELLRLAPLLKAIASGAEPPLAQGAAAAPAAGLQEMALGFGGPGGGGGMTMGGQRLGADGQPVRRKRKRRRKVPKAKDEV